MSRITCFNTNLACLAFEIDTRHFPMVDTGDSQRLVDSFRLVDRPSLTSRSTAPIWTDGHLNPIRSSSKNIQIYRSPSRIASLELLWVMDQLQALPMACYSAREGSLRPNEMVVEEDLQVGPPTVEQLALSQI
ncbi:hypothetical protein Adt_12665 [Abeliophyllum distichum]|uniref:Uncharacterized protein n=1 Tax=Abeliophyllum distichum TaxID=126358 RepID=A0ABD1URD7_9LAMI